MQFFRLTTSKKVLAKPQLRTKAANENRSAFAVSTVSTGEVSFQASKDKALTPGESDALKFRLDPSVEHWKNWQFDESDFSSTSEMLTAAVQQISGAIERSGGLSSITSAAYWAYHIARNSFFGIQGATGIIYSDLQQWLRTSGADRESSYSLGIGARIRLVCESYECFAQDIQNINKGIYKLPWDMTTLSHRQYNPLFVLGKASEFLEEASLTLGRRKAQKQEPVWLQSDLYPDYYVSTFHYQTDGWFSSKSASIYETSTETLFLGRQDAMQRQSLVPLHFWLQETRADPQDLTLLEVGCGTGRFHTFIKDNYPSMRTAALDLSPYYLQAARDNVDYWRRIAGPSSAAPTAFLHAAAESVPMEDSSADVVMSVYMFHEMPRHAQEAAAAEMARVLRPGGLLVLCDSIQRGDRPAFDGRITNFSRFNEPHYEAFVDADFGGMFEALGMRPYMKNMASSTKVLSFVKEAKAE
eukprot:CAMPEP_0177587304 /NCGR_PEP_ID=MMETSP0419_2-20121207/5565_1 /TAXON_ID=582737 /ORGANISM="Tetraselmis sp., Strain GSL018" /LENGTH=470 /DNA_ID=CAMNT_0019077315 /DNA_START=166 /DNA_END=1579 /DNA_ORIENTATION=+